jgi:hypothetical protein
MRCLYFFNMVSVRSLSEKAFQIFLGNVGASPDRGEIHLHAP